MRKITFLLCSLLLCCIGVTAQTNEVKKIKLGNQVTALADFEDGGYYLMFNTGRGTFLNEHADGSLWLDYPHALAEFDNSTTESNFVVKLMKSGENWKFQLNSGKFIPVLSHGGAMSSSETAAEFSVGVYAEGHFYINGTGGNNYQLNGNGTNGSVGSSGTLTGWDKSNNAGGNSDYQFYRVEMETVQTVTVTYIYQLNGREYARREEVLAINAELPAAPVLDYLVVDSYDVETGTVIDKDTTVRLTCHESLPFVASENFSDATWYAIDIHSNNQPYYWKYEADNDVNVQTPVTVTSSKEVIADEYLWCFSGNLIDGFKIYNKAAGEGKTLHWSGSNFTLGEVTADNSFKLVASTAISGATCFTLDGSNYVNHNGALKKHNEPDYGSSCRFFAPSYFMLNCANGYLQQAAAPEGAVGTNSDVFAVTENLLAARDAVVASPYDEEAMSSLSALLTGINDENVIPMEAGKYYRVQNYLRKDAAGNGKMLGVSVAGGRVASAAGKSDVSLIWKFEDCTENGETGYKVYSPNHKAYMGTAPDTDNTLVGSYEQGGRYRLVSLGGAQFNLKDVNNKNLVIYAGGGIGGWNPNPMNSDGAWYIIPATDIEVAMHAAEDKTWATAYLPFGVSVPADGGLEICTATLAASGEEKVLGLTAVSGVPAETGVVLRGTETSYVLAIDDDVTLDDKGVLAGSLVSSTDDTNSSVYVLSNGSKGVGFYHPNGTTLAANKAYLAGSELTQGVSAFRFFFGDVTGIGGIHSVGNVPAGSCYDLSGRRVTIPARGIYVKDGKKVFVK